jgi:hypothetical protein
VSELRVVFLIVTGFGAWLLLWILILVRVDCFPVFCWNIQYGVVGRAGL